MGKGLLPPGIRFHATDVELIMFYLKRKVMGKSIPYEIISEQKIYEFSPQDLPGQSSLKSKDLEWYFFCRREKKYETGGRMKRTTKWGHWKTTGNDKTVVHENRTVGYRRTLIFHEGRAPQGTRTDWVMYEYRLDDEVLANIEIDKDEFVICKLFQKSGAGPQVGAHYGAPYIEEDWNSDDESDLVKSILFPSMAAPETVLSDIPELQPSKNGNDENEVDKPSNTQNVNGGALPVEEEDIYGELGDLSDLHEMFYPTGDAQDRLYPAGSFMELCDLDHPLEGPSDGCGPNFVPPSGDSSGPNFVPPSGDSSGSNFVPPSEVCMGHDYSDNPEHLGNPSNGCGVVNPVLASRSYGFENQMDVFPKDQADLADLFLELHDLVKPLEGPAATFHDGFENQIDMLAKKSVGENAKRGYRALGSASYNTEGLEADGGRAVQTHKRGREQTRSYWRLQQLLDSIPSRPASAAEHHVGSSSRREKNTCIFCTSVGVVGGCFDEDEEALSDKLELACMGYCERNPNLHRRWRKRDFRKEAAVWDGNIMFVLLLGMLSTLMWVFIATIVMKLGRLAWDLLS